MNAAASTILDNLKDFAVAYTRAYLAYTDAGLPPEQAVSEARFIAFLAVSPEAAPANLMSFGPRESQA